MKYLSINQDMMTYFEMLSFCANLGYESTKVLYHVLPNGVIKLSGDREVLDMFDQYKKARLYNILTYVNAGPTTFSVEVVNNNFEGLVSKDEGVAEEEEDGGWTHNWP